MVPLRPYSSIRLRSDHFLFLVPLIGLPSRTPFALDHRDEGVKPSKSKRYRDPDEEQGSKGAQSDRRWGYRGPSRSDRWLHVEGADASGRRSAVAMGLLCISEPSDVGEPLTKRTGQIVLRESWVRLR
ncbi:hypothetical protein BHE74_00013312 [Ensete ventricosum]|nr:hypothetical protein BHE74_00013312 [Ensete ventricosum]